MSDCSLILREAEEKDLDILFEWANDEDVRKWSFSKKQINYEEHYNWFKSSLKNTNRKMYILEKASEPVGTLRWDLCDNQAVVSYLIAKQWRGLGYGKIIISMGEKVLPSSVNLLMAEVVNGNHRSAHIFESLGYEKENDGTGNLIFRKRILR